MGGRMSKEKGKEGERDVRNLFRQLYKGHMDDVEDIRRNHQQAEIGGADLIGVPHFSVEVKRVKEFYGDKELDLWWSQTVEQSKKDGKIPCLVMRKNRGQWLVVVNVWSEFWSEGVSPVIGTMRWRDFERYARAVLAAD